MHRVAFFDNRIIDADTPSYSSSNISWAALSNKAASQKRRKYQLIAEELRGQTKKRSLLRLTRPCFEAPTGHFFSTSRPILFGAAPCVASCVVDRDREREVDK